MATNRKFDVRKLALSDDLYSIAIKVATTRTSICMSQGELADKIGTNHLHIARVERGQTTLTDANRSAIEAVLGISLS